MTFDCKVCDTVIIDDYGGGHRCVVLTSPNEDDCVVIVNFSSATNHISDGKVFTRNDSRILFDHPTTVPYRYAKLFPVTSLRAEVNRPDIVSDYVLCPLNIMAQIIEDAFKSQFTKGEVIEELKTYYPKEYEQYYEDTKLE